MTQEGFSGYPEWVGPNRSAELSVQHDVETYSRVSDNGMTWETSPSGRRRLIIEGEAKYLDEIARVLMPTLDAVRAEISGNLV